ncbi:hypothetical protein GCM10009802_31880 [Streptomyces synnematoformans]|uniref:Uncharacterized protein n=1 Tax=Streptomyces synnematoformans TaxID=415721 RepID=A0ABN2YEA9_9ACTN
MAVIAALAFGTWKWEQGQLEAETFDLTGSVLLSGELETAPEGTCRGARGGVAPGAAVTVYGAGGEVVATGGLGSSWQQSDGACRFRFRVADVPVGGDLYQVQVAAGQRTTISRATAESGRTELRVGRSG